MLKRATYQGTRVRQLIYSRLRNAKDVNGGRLLAPRKILTRVTTTLEVSSKPKEFWYVSRREMYEAVLIWERSGGLVVSACAIRSWTIDQRVISLPPMWDWVWRRLDAVRHIFLKNLIQWISYTHTWSNQVSFKYFLWAAVFNCNSAHCGSNMFCFGISNLIPENSRKIFFCKKWIAVWVSVNIYGDRGYFV
jgi:hypothetical protein